MKWRLPACLPAVFTCLSFAAAISIHPLYSQWPYSILGNRFGLLLAQTELFQAPQSDRGILLVSMKAPMHLDNARKRHILVSVVETLEKTHSCLAIHIWHLLSRPLMMMIYGTLSHRRSSGIIPERMHGKFNSEARRGYQDAASAASRRQRTHSLLQHARGAAVRGGHGWAGVELQTLCSKQLAYRIRSVT